MPTPSTPDPNDQMIAAMTAALAGGATTPTSPVKIARNVAASSQPTPAPTTAPSSAAVTPPSAAPLHAPAAAPPAAPSTKGGAAPVVTLTLAARYTTDNSDAFIRSLGFTAANEINTLKSVVTLATAEIMRIDIELKIGRASCRERVLQVV